MLKASWLALLIVRMLLPAAGFADDVRSSGADDEPLPVVTLSVEILHSESKYASRWQLLHPGEALTDSDDWPQSIDDFNFQDASGLARVSKLRNFSLLTLAEIGKARLFLGINEEGLVGLHFNAVPHYGVERYMEIVRMPYLKKNGPDIEVER